MTLIRPIDSASDAEIRLVARRMRDTLVEVLGEARGGAMYSMEWLEARVRWHLDSSASTAAVFVAAKSAGGAIVGHTIVRGEATSYGTRAGSAAASSADDSHTMGLFSTIYVMPKARCEGVASALIDRGEEWMRRQGMSVAATLTAADNTKLHRLFAARGYALTSLPDDFVKLSRAL